MTADIDAGRKAAQIFPLVSIIRRSAAFACVLGAVLAANCSPVHAHDAALGWSYPFSCCSNHDCRSVKTKAISERAEGYVINVTGEVVPYADTRVRHSPDGEFHWCSVAGEDNSRTICLFVPPRSF